MQGDGKYIDCIIASDYDINPGPIGIGGRGDPVSTIGFNGLCMVVSDHPLTPEKHADSPKSDCNSDERIQYNT